MADPAGKAAGPAGVAAAPAPRKPVKLKVDGREVVVPLGSSILQAAKALGIDIPTFCYHPGLSLAGNCRICLVEASNSKKPVTACSTPVAEGIEVLTGSEMARRARAGVLELMLLNHPLDCPICDKAGECMLQDHTYDHGRSGSRMVEEKVLKHTKPLGSTISIWGNRCILCTRCVRFCDEVSGTGELCVVGRGDRSVVDVFPGQPLENPLAGNTVDLCPVGALISRDFLYQARVWDLKKTESICADCARGCNIEIHTREDRIARLVPRENGAVNGWWICDQGRHGLRHVTDGRRRLEARPRESLGETAGRRLARKLKAIVERHGPGSVAGITSSFQTLEELYLFRRLLARLRSDRMGAIERPPGREERFKGGFTISSDKNPNRRGAERVLGEGAFEGGLREVLEAAGRGEVKGLIVAADLPGVALEERIVEVLGRLEHAAVILLAEDGRIPAAADIIPATTFAEKDGSMVNEDGRIQRLRPALPPPGGVRSETEVLQEALVELGERPRVLSADGVFRELSREAVPELRGLSHRDLGSLGRPLDGPAAPGAGAGSGGGR